MTTPPGTTVVQLRKRVKLTRRGMHCGRRRRKTLWTLNLKQRRCELPGIARPVQSVSYSCPLTSTCRLSSLARPRAHGLVSTAVISMACSDALMPLLMVVNMLLLLCSITMILLLVVFIICANFEGMRVWFLCLRGTALTRASSFPTRLNACVVVILHQRKTCVCEYPTVPAPRCHYRRCCFFFLRARACSIVRCPVAFGLAA